MTTPSAAGVIWSGSVWHERSSPSRHRFDYRMWWADLDLDRIDHTLGHLRMLGTGRGRPLRFARSDYLGDPATDLATEVRDLVERRTGTLPDGPVRLVGHLRTLGWCFNPIALYLCHDAEGTLTWIVADVTNTPWKERHQYVLPADATGVHGHVEDKALHVSPFMGMDQRYRFDIDVSGEALRVRIVTIDGDTEPFAAGVDLTSRPMTDPALLTSLARHPLLTMRVSLGIHTQALRLWRKRVPIQPHPDRRRQEVPSR
ncbi:MAG: DUF1365 domain-containing protein [Acidimicrobiales bacterium]